MTLERINQSLFGALGQRLRGAPRGLILFLLASACIAAISGIFEPSFNNYLSDTFDPPAALRGMLELPRETPGFLVAVMTGALFFMAETRMAALCSLIMLIGMWVLGLASSSWTVMLIGMTIQTTGAHLFQPLTRSLALQLAHERARGRRLGQVGTVGAIASIAGGGLVWLGFKWSAVDGWLARTSPGSHVAGALRPVFGHWSYAASFYTAAGIAAVALVLFLAMPKHLGEAAHVRPRLVVRRRYSVYYLMCLLFGARKQVFITFGPWVLVRVFHQPVSVFAQLWIISQVIQVFFQPVLGRLIDRIGERTILVVDGFVLIVISAAYGFLPTGSHLALNLLLACYVLDNVSFAVGIARDTYMSKIAQQPEDVAPTISLGISINHAVSMSLPWVGGWAWDRFGHQSVFIASAVVAVGNVIASAMVRTPRLGPREAELDAEALEQAGPAHGTGGGEPAD